MWMQFAFSFLKWLVVPPLKWGKAATRFLPSCPTTAYVMQGTLWTQTLSTCMFGLGSIFRQEKSLRFNTFQHLMGLTEEEKRFGKNGILTVHASVVVTQLSVEPISVLSNVLTAMLEVYSPQTLWTICCPGPVSNAAVRSNVIKLTLLPHSVQLTNLTEDRSRLYFL